MKREDDQELWDLLGKAEGPPALSPFFARDVVRQIRQENGWRERLSAWLRPRRLIPATAVALAVVAAAISLQHSAEDASSDNPAGLVASIDPQDYEVVADLDDLLASEDDNLWTDEASPL